MEEIFEPIVHYWPLLVGVVTLVIYLATLGIAKKRNEEEHIQFERTFATTKQDNESKLRELESKYESLASAFHSTEMKHGEMLASIQVTMKFMQESLSALSCKIDQLLAKK